MAEAPACPLRAVRLSWRNCKQVWAPLELDKSRHPTWRGAARRPTKEREEPRKATSITWRVHARVFHRHGNIIFPFG